MKDKIHLIVEETDCEPQEARVALEISQYNVEHAIRLISGAFRSILVIKGKFNIVSRNLYGLLILIFNVREKSLLRCKTIVSYNPTVFETDLNLYWYEFEKKLYTFRLWEGSIQSLTQELESSLNESVSSEDKRDFFIRLKQDYKGTEWIGKKLNRIIAEKFIGETVSLLLAREELNLNQFRHLTDKQSIPVIADKYALSLTENNPLMLEIELVTSKNGGISANAIKSGDEVFAVVTDNRDIAKYLTHLLGGKTKDRLTPIPTMVEKIVKENGKIQLQTRFTSGILGSTVIEPEARIKIVRNGSDNWWKNFVAWLKITRKQE